MKDLRPSPGSQWLPGGMLIALALIVGGAAGLAIGFRSWPPYLGLVLVALLAIGFVDNLLAQRSATPPSSRVRRRLRVIQGGKAYDLSEEDATKDQRYLM